MSLCFLGASFGPVRTTSSFVVSTVLVAATLVTAAGLAAGGGVDGATVEDGMILVEIFFK